MNLKEALIDILIAFMMLAPIAYISWYCDFYLAWKTGCCGKLKFKQFKQFYAIAPKKWELCYYQIRKICRMISRN